MSNALPPTETTSSALFRERSAVLNSNGPNRTRVALGKPVRTAGIVDSARSSSTAPSSVRCK
jgi:hypothetical protein